MIHNEQPIDAQERAEQGTPDSTDVTPWEQIEPGRFMPRRIRGSFRGGKLG